MQSSSRQSCLLYLSCCLLAVWTVPYRDVRRRRWLLARRCGRNRGPTDDTPGLELFCRLVSKIDIRYQICDSRWLFVYIRMCVCVHVCERLWSAKTCDGTPACAEGGEGREGIKGT